MGTTTKNSTTPKMEKLIAFMREHGGKIHCHPGGFWSRVDWKYDGPHFGTPSVAALVRRGLATYTAEKERTFGQSFPIEATLLPTHGQAIENAMLAKHTNVI